MPIRRSRTVTRKRTVGGRRKRGKFMDWMRKAGSWIKTNGPGIAQKALQVFQNPAVRSIASQLAPASAGYFNRGDQIIKAVSGSGRRRIRIPIRTKNGRIRRGHRDYGFLDMYGVFNYHTKFNC